MGFAKLAIGVFGVLIVAVALEAQAAVPATEQQLQADPRYKAQREAEARARAQQEAVQRAKAAQDAAQRARAEQEARQRADVAAKQAAEAREQPLHDAEALMQAGKPAEAYALLEPMEFERAGEVRFDYLLGIAALDSGKPDKATLVFERVLAVDPNFAGARLDMARAYFQLGDLPRAKTEFETVAKQNPPPAARATIQKYLDAIEAQNRAKRTRFTAYVEGGLGRDNNVNNSTSQSQISVPAFGNLVFTLSPTSLKTADTYFTVAAGAEASHNLNANWGVYGGADVRQRNNRSQHSFNTQNLDGHAGVTLANDDNIFRVGVMAGQYRLAKKHNRDSSGFSADWRHVYSPSNQASVFMQYLRSRFVETTMTVNDFDQTILGAGGLHVLANGKSAFFGSLFGTRENDVAPITLTNPSGGRADGDKRGLGVRAGGQAALGEAAELFASAGWQSGKYDKENAAFLRKRSDRQSDLSVGVNWHPDKNWVLRPQVSYTKNNSNIAIYTYDRMDVSLTVRRDFR